VLNTVASYQVVVVSAVVLVGVDGAAFDPLMEETIEDDDNDDNDRRDCVMSRTRNDDTVVCVGKRNKLIVTMDGYIIALLELELAIGRNVVECDA
jgi:hypothetical protein